MPRGTGELAQPLKAGVGGWQVGGRDPGKIMISKTHIPHL